MVLESLGDVGVVIERINQNKQKYIHMQHNHFKSKGMHKSVSLQPIEKCN